LDELEERKLKVRTARTMTVDPNSPAKSPWLAFELRPMLSMNVTTGVFTIQANAPRIYPTIKKPMSVPLRPNSYRADSTTQRVNWEVIGLLHR
jgi:hypothetical protein